MMNELEVYKLYTGLQLHFKQKSYDFFKYKGEVKVSVDSFNKRKNHEKYYFKKISQRNEPKMYVVGNMVFGEKKYISNFNEENYLEYRKFICDGTNIFTKEISTLDKPIKTYLNGDFPEIVRLLANNQLSLYTVCALEKLFKWTESCDNEILKSQLMQIQKTYQFFKYDEIAIKKAILDHEELINKNVT